MRKELSIAIDTAPEKTNFWSGNNYTISFPYNDIISASLIVLINK